MKGNALTFPADGEGRAEGSSSPLLLWCQQLLPMGNLCSQRNLGGSAACSAGNMLEGGREGEVVGAKHSEGMLEGTRWFPGGTDAICMVLAVPVRRAGNQRSLQEACAAASVLLPSPLSPQPLTRVPGIRSMASQCPQMSSFLLACPSWCKMSSGEPRAHPWPCGSG